MVRRKIMKMTSCTISSLYLINTYFTDYFAKLTTTNTYHDKYPEMSYFKDAREFNILSE